MERGRALGGLRIALREPSDAKMPGNRARAEPPISTRNAWQQVLLFSGGGYCQATDVTHGSGQDNPA
eukprot:4639382-Alexandrium_andersonii.AAC.1